MPAIVSIRDFTHGEASPQYTSRTDLEIYDKSASYIKNMMVKPNGSVISRFGFKNLAGINGNGFKIIPFVVQNVASTYYYLCVLSITSTVICEFYRCDSSGNLTLSYTLNSGLNTYYDHQVIENRLILIGNLSPIYFECDNTGIITGPFQLFDLTKSISAIPTRIYDQSYTASTFELSNTTVGDARTLTITNLVAPFLGFNQYYVGGEFTSLGAKTSDTIGSAIITSVQSTTVCTVKIINEFRDNLPDQTTYSTTISSGSGTDFYIPLVINTASDVTVTIEGNVIPPSNYTITNITTNGFDIHFNPSPSTGLMQISINPQEIIQGTSCTLSEQAYSTIRGFPQCISFYQDRLYFAGGPSCPLSIFASQVGNYNNFSLGIGLDSDALSTTIDEHGDRIINLQSGKTLYIFTQYTEYASELSTGEALTPSNIYSIKLQSTAGSNGTKPINFDNQVIYSKRSGNTIMSMHMADYQYTYTSDNISFYSSHLINNPVEFTAYTSNPNFDSNMLFIINDNKELVLYESLNSQNVSAFTRVESDTDIISICVLNDFVFILYETEIGADQQIGIIDFEIPLDHFQYELPLSGTNINIGSSYSDKEISIIKKSNDIMDYTYIGSVIADISGIINVSTLGITDTTNLYFGLSFEQKIVTMPIHIMTPNGDNRYLDKNITKMYIEFYKSYTFEIGIDFFDLNKFKSGDAYPYTFSGIQIPMNNLTSYSNIGWGSGNYSINYFSGIYSYTLNAGNIPTIMVTCRQNLPLPIEILGIALELKI